MLTHFPSQVLTSLFYFGVCYISMAENVPLTLLARTGTVPPGRADNYRLDGIYPPIVGRNGSIAFQALVTYLPLNSPNNPPQRLNDTPMFYIGTPQNLVWSNATQIPVATPANTTHRVLTIPTINTNGQFFGRMIYTTALAGGSTQTGYGYSTGSNTAAPQLVYRENISPVEFPGYQLFPLNNIGAEHNLNDSGQMTFLCRIAVSGQNTTAGIFTKTLSGALTQVARTSQPATATVPTFNFLGEPATTDNGTVIFATTSPGSTDYTLWSRSSAGTLVPLVQRGFAAPTSTPNEIFRTLPVRYQPAVAANGTTVFTARYGANGQSDKHGIFIGTPGNLTQVIPPSLAPGVDYIILAESSSDTLRLNDNGTLIYNASYFRVLNGSVDSGFAIIARYQGISTPAVKSGDQAPGTPAGVTFKDFDQYENLLNNRDEIVFRARVQGPGITSGTNSSGYWTTNIATGVTRLIIRDSDVLATGPGTTTTARINFSDSLQGTGRFLPRGGGSGGQFSDTGRFAFKVRYQSAGSPVADGDFALFSADLTSTPLSGLAQWRLTNFGSAENSGPGADLSVPGPDALPNLVRYALGLQAGENGATDGTAPQVALQEIEGTAYPVLSFIYDPAATSVRLAVSIGTDPGTMSWQEGNIYVGTALSISNPVSTELTRTTLADGRLAITVRGNTPVTSLTRQFIRLSATSVAP